MTHSFANITISRPNCDAADREHWCWSRLGGLRAVPPKACYCFLPFTVVASHLGEHISSRLLINIMYLNLVFVVVVDQCFCGS